MIRQEHIQDLKLALEVKKALRAKGVKGEFMVDFMLEDIRKKRREAQC